MREIKFQGKRIDNGEWVYGWYLQTNTGEYRIANIDENGIPQLYPVIPETVGQYTERKDINGEEIYQGNICKVTIYDHWGRKISETNCPVVIEEFKIGVRHGYREEVIHFDGFCNTTFEVIGNIYDNPELLSKGRGEK